MDIEKMTRLEREELPVSARYPALPHGAAHPNDPYSGVRTAISR